MVTMLVSTAISAQRFEGSIGFTKNIVPVTANYIYHVKDDMIRVE